MATSYKTPGVYIEEISKLPPSVAQVETAIPAFIGYTQRRGTTTSPLPTQVVAVGATNVTVAEPVRITSLLEFVELFGTGPNEVVTVTIDELMAAGELVRRTVKAVVATPGAFTLFYHMQMYFANGGGPCWIVSVGLTTETLGDDAFLAGLQIIRAYDEPTLLLMPEAHSLAESAAADRYAIYVEALDQAADLGDRFVIMDVKAGEDGAFRNGVTGTNLKYGAAYTPFLRTTVNYLYDINGVAITRNIRVNEDADTTDTDESSATVQFSILTTEVQALVRAEVDKLRVVLPPSSAVAGCYAAVDSTRGVWKAPANVSLAMVSGLTKAITDEAQRDLNVHSTGKSINAIRAFTGRGILIWGARTLAGNDNEWRYVPVRRLFNMVEESSKKATEGFVFEPNDANTWVKVQGMLENFLTTLWRQGALQGAKPEHAFYVAVGLNKTMTALDILEGRMIVEIGLAAVRPAEFIILRFSHKMAES